MGQGWQGTDRLVDFLSLPQEPLRRADLRDIVLRTLADHAPGLYLELLILRRGGRVIAEIRGVVIERAIRGGHRGVDIARFLNISGNHRFRIRGLSVGPTPGALRFPANAPFGDRP
jgi:hypothetical protein